MSLIFNALQRLGRTQDGLNKKPPDQASRRNALPLHGIFMSPAALLTTAGLIVLAGVIAIQVTQTISAKVRKPAALTQPPAPLTASASPQLRQVPTAIEQSGAPAGPPPVQPAEKPLEVVDQVSPGSHIGQIGAGTEATFYPPEPGESADAGVPAVDPPRPGEKVPGGEPTGSVGPTVRVTSGENPMPATTRHSVTGTEPATTAAVDRTGGAKSLPAALVDSKLNGDKMRRSEPFKAPASAEEEERNAVQLDHQRQAAQAALHQDVALLVQQIGTAMQFDDHASVAVLMKQLEQIQGPDNLFLLRLKAYWRIRQNQLAQAQTLLQQVLSRMPGDRESGLNLAVVEMRLGHAEAARRRLRQLQDLYPEDRRIVDALERLDNQTR